MKNESASHGIVSVLYYKCYNASLLGEFENMKMYYEFLGQEYKNSEDKSPFQNFLNQEKMKELKLVKQQLEMGKMFEVFEEFTPMEHEMELTDTEIEEEALIVKKVGRNQKMLEPLLGGKIRLNSLEHECGSKKKKDRCDMVSLNDAGTLFPIEFKLKKATHAVVGQIAKYCLHFKLRLINQTYERVQGVVIAHSYSKFAINELKKRGYICLLHSGTLDSLRLTSFR